jgi:hypothetical protein
MKTLNFLNGVSESGLYFITSGQVQRAIGKQDPFKDVSNPAEHAKKIKKLSEAIEQEINESITVSVKRTPPDEDPELQIKPDTLKDPAGQK